VPVWFRPVAVDCGRPARATKCLARLGEHLAPRVRYNPRQMRVIVVGGGEIGFALAQSLSTSGHEVFVLDNQPEVGARFASLDVQFVVGTGTSAEILERAGIQHADVFVACTGLDEVNIVSCAIARQLGSPRTFCFVSREDFVELQDLRGLAHFGIDRLVWPEAQLAADIERIIGVPGALDAEAFADGAVHLVEYRLEADSSLAGRRIADLHLAHGSLIVAVRRGDTVFIPRSWVRRRGCATCVAGSRRPRMHGASV
jgi:trk system potassium uptake protein